MSTKNLTLVRDRLRYHLSKATKWDKKNLPYDQDRVPSKDINNNGFGIPFKEQWRYILNKLELSIKDRFPNFVMEPNLWLTTFDISVRESTIIIWKKLEKGINE